MHAQEARAMRCAKTGGHPPGKEAVLEGEICPGHPLKVPGVEIEAHAHRVVRTPHHDALPSADTAPAGEILEARAWPGHLVSLGRRRGQMNVAVKVRLHPEHDSVGLTGRCDVKVELQDLSLGGRGEEVEVPNLSWRGEGAEVAVGERPHCSMRCREAVQVHRIRLHPRDGPGLDFHELRE